LGHNVCTDSVPGSIPVPRGDGRVTLRIDGAVAHVLFDRPWARNAMTWAMYDGLATSCAAIDTNTSVRVAVLRGAGGKAFVAGTDIAQFRGFATGDDGIAYEAKLDGFIETLERLRVPSIAVVEGFAVGAGLAIANACDIRIASSGARFGVPPGITVRCGIFFGPSESQCGRNAGNPSFDRPGVTRAPPACRPDKLREQVFHLGCR